jgi:hypothetical protein
MIVNRKMLGYKHYVGSYPVIMVVIIPLSIVIEGKIAV